MYKLALAFIAFLVVGEISLIFSRRLYKTRYQANKVLDAILPYDDLVNHAANIARSHSITYKKDAVRVLFDRLESNYNYITMIHKELLEKSGSEIKMPSAAEWLLDNYYILEQHIKQTQRSEVKKFLKKLPVIADGESKGLPRVYVIATELIAHTDAKIDKNTIVGFVQWYQSEQSLTSVELWALPIMLKMVIVENIAYICRKIRLSRKEYEHAERYVRFISTKLDDNNAIKEKIDRYFSHNSRISESFIEQLLTSLKKLGKSSAYTLSLIDSHLFDRAYTASGLVLLEHKRQAARQISIGNSIVSLITISSIDWANVFMSISKTEEILLKDPSGAYEKMDAESKDYYRQSIKKLSDKLKISETALVSKALDRSLAAKEFDLEKRHIGYYIVGEGKDDFIAKIKGKKDTISKTKPYLPKLYTALIILASFLILLTLFGIINYLTTPLASIVISVLAIIPASDICLKIINNRVCACQCKKILPRLDFENEIPNDLSTFVIVPTLILNEKNAEELANNLEVHYLANRQDNLFFALVADFKDANYESKPDEEAVMDKAANLILELNKKYPSEIDKFYFFGRKRKFNKAEKRYMGWERKRGAILEFVHFLKTGDAGSFYKIQGKAQNLPPIKYVITLDSDTKLFKSVAVQLIGTLAHPLSHIKMDKDKKVVTKGYGLIQPRIGVDIESANKTLFSKIFAGQGGIDPYCNAVSDIYQDLFGEGIFTGKGIFDVDAFYETLKDAIPENTVLSHDLLEGSYLRCGLAGDIEVSDGYPAAYLSYIKRLHRWTRGDWQLIVWLFGHIKNANGDQIKNPLNAVSRFKIADNLRRSLVSISLLLLIIIGVLVFNEAWLISIIFASIALGMSLISATVSAAICADLTVIGRHSKATIIYGVKGAFLEFITLFFALPYNAYMMADAILKTLWRVFVSHKNMLEWVTAADAESKHKGGFFDHYKKMWICPVLGAVFLAFSIYAKANYLHSVAPLIIGLLWAVAPTYIWYISKPFVEKEVKISDESYDLRKLSRLTWRYFEELAGEAENFLPPDNIQLDPPNGIAHRTSPTNIGLLLIALLSARDFGYLTTSKMAEWINNVLLTIEKLPKWRGHLYNWYNTKTLEVLPPCYISTVDSGNYLGYLMTLRQGLFDLLEKPLLDKNLLIGLLDTIKIAKSQDKYMAINDRAIKILANKDNLKAADIKTAIDELLKADFNNGGTWAKKVESMAISIKEEADLNEEKTNLLKDNICKIIEKVNKIIDEIEFLPLFDKDRQLFSIGYNVSEEQLTKSYYDLLASEARQTSFISIAKGEISHKHWFKLGRGLTSADGYRGLVSWSGTMFEYLMPLLIMKNVDNTLLSESYWFALREQQKYGKKNGVPWGASESAFFNFDINLNYQYKAFGAPVLGMKRGLINDIVISPYSTVLALMVNKAAATENIKRLKNEGMEGPYGLYEAIDYTRIRLSKDEKSVIIKSYMVHHQGMSFIALDNVLNNNIMQKRFHKDPLVRSAEYLLGERMNTRAIIMDATKHENQPTRKPAKRQYFSSVRVYNLPEYPLPAVHLLSNGSYNIFINDKGQGYSKWGDINVTRWRNCDNISGYGSYVYISNITNGGLWSNTYAPFNYGSEKYKVVFSPDKAEFLRSDGQLDTRTEVIVSAEDNAEIRRISVTNHDSQDKILEFSSYLELVLAPHKDDQAHRAFSNLFVHTEFAGHFNALVASRRPRSEKDKELWAAHLLVVDGEQAGAISYETDRLKFIGRNNTVANPVALLDGQPVSNSVGAVLDPIFSLKCRVKIPAGATVRISYVTLVSQTHKELCSLCSKYNSIPVIEAAFELSQTRSQMEIRYLGLDQGDEEEFLSLLPHLVYNSPSKEQYAKEISQNMLGQKSLWEQGISGDLPIILVLASETEQTRFISRILKCHEYLRLKGFKCDLIILCIEEGGYTQTLFEQVNETVAVSHAREMQNVSGGVFVRSSKSITNEFKDLLVKVAKVVLNADMHISSQIATLNGHAPINQVSLVSARGEDAVLPPDLEFNNGYGGFDTKNNEYVILIKDDQRTPLPWSNIIANPHFGTIVTESGGGYTWCENSRENKISPWTNDPVCDTQSESLYIKDLDTGEVFSSMPISGRHGGGYLIRHGTGYSAFEHNCVGLSVVQTVFVPINERVKLITLTIKNNGESRRLAVTYGFKPVLGVSEDVSYISTEFNGKTLFIKNTYNTDFPSMTAFLTTSGESVSATGDAIGFEHLPDKIPYALGTDSLNGKTGAGFEAYCAVQAKTQVLKNGEVTLVFMLGEGESSEEIQGIIEKYSNPNAAISELNNVKEFWSRITGTVLIKTPDKSMDIMVNSWLLYQTVSSRLFARTAFYQCGGAFGFRDQLQDVLSLLHTAPNLTKNQILLHASHQFEEGDVQHWWHKEYIGGADRGVRTKFTDDLLWLVYVTCEYIEKTGDYTILDEICPYIKDEPLGEDDERYSIPRVSELRETLYYHCIRAVSRALNYGERGLLLMGSGDWNDGMSTVGNKGKGESVWLSWFVCDILKKFIKICDYKKDYAKVQEYENALKKLTENIDKNAWDGHWYLRAFFDDGTPLGSSQNTECSIDAIAQAWSVISGAGQPDKTKEAMESAERYLVRREHAIITLLTPPFDAGDLKPGYIKGYLPGIRENGGQYTHATAWVIMALARMGQGDKAWEYYNMINPINHARTAMEAMHYKTEPYVIAADVYSNPQHTGRGGWTWYTGAAGWLYKVAVEEILGIVRKADTLQINPCIPTHWESFELSYHYNSTKYNIKVKNPEHINREVKSVTIDGQTCDDFIIKLTDDAKDHNVLVIMGNKSE